MTGWRRTLELVLRERNLQYTTAISDRRSNMATRIGLIMRAFTSEFVVIRPTAGSPEERAATDQLVRYFVNQWEEIFYTKYPVLNDGEVQDDTLRERNLILIGNQRVNLVWHRFESHLPKIGPNQIDIRNNVYNEECLTIESIIESPINPKSRWITLGSWDPVNCHIGMDYLPINGWFDFAVWNKNSNDKQQNLLIASRYVDE